MKLNIVSWNGTTDINNDTNFDSWYEIKQQFVPTRKGIYSERQERPQKLSGAAFDDYSFTFKTKCLGTIHSQRETFKGYFSMEDFTPHSLVFEDTADSNRQWYLEGLATKIFEETPGVMVTTLAVDEPFLRTVVESTGTLAVTSSGQNVVFNVVGNMNMRPTITLTPTSAKTGDFGYSRWVSVHNPGDKIFDNYPLDFGGVDTAALIAGGKMQTDGTDYLLQIDGNVVDRWFGTTDGRGINTTDTALWGIIDLAPRVELPLKNAIGTTDTRIDFTATTSAQISDLFRAKNAANKVFKVNNEAITYSSITYNRVEAYANVTTRGAKGTTAASHSVGDLAKFLEHDIWQVYGSSDYSTTSTDYYTVDDNNEPMFDPHSTNTSWIYYTFREWGIPRPGSWIPQRVNVGKGRKSDFYTGLQTANADPATRAGMKISAYQYVSWRGDNGDIRWLLNHPGGVTAVEVDGQKYLANFTSSVWPDTAGLQYKHPQTGLWVTADNQAIPTTSTWQAFTIASTDTGVISPTSYAIQFIMSGSVVGAANNYAAIEANTVTVSCSTSATPQVTVGAEQSKYVFNAKITNSTTGEWIRIRAVVSLNDVVTIDCDAKTVTLQDGTNLRAGLTFSSVRTNWLDFVPGNNTITYTEAAVTGVTMDISGEGRNTL